MKGDGEREGKVLECEGHSVVVRVKEDDESEGKV